MAGVGALVAEAAAGEHGLDRLALFDEPRAVLAVDRVLRGGGLGLEELAVIEIVGVLHVARGVELRDVQGLEALVVRDHLAVVLQREAHRAEHVLALALHQRDRVIGAAAEHRRHRNVKRGDGVELALQLLLPEALHAHGQLLGDLTLEIVDLAAEGALRLFGQPAEVFQQRRHQTLLAEKGDAQLLQLALALDPLQLVEKAGLEITDFFIHIDNLRQ